MLRASKILPANETTARAALKLVLDHDQRRLRRKLLVATDGTEVMVDLPETTTLEHGGALEAEDGTLIGIEAAPEPLYAVSAKSAADLVRLAWHIGNRHTPAELAADKILIRRDHVLGAMLIGLGAKIAEIEAPFSPEHGAYHGHAHDHGDAGHALLYKRQG
jgi:urease accessory protein